MTAFLWCVVAWFLFVWGNRLGGLWPRFAHSQKPDAFLDLVEEAVPGPYLELFARRARFGWDYWGNESLATVDLAS